MKLSANGLCFGYTRKRKKAIRVGGPCRIEFPTGKIVCLLGRNGSGKSTLLRTLAGLLPPLQGSVQIDNQNITTIGFRQLARLRSVVLTNRGTPPLLKAYEWVALGRHPHLTWSARMTDADHEVVHRCLDWVNAQHLAEKLLHKMSDGERQRISLARALAQESPFLLLDEPSTFLDLPSRFSLFSILRRLAHEKGKGVLLSTHELDLSMRMADELWVLNGDRLISGNPEELAKSGELQEAFSTRDTTIRFINGHMEINTKAKPECGNEFAK